MLTIEMLEDARVVIALILTIFGAFSGMVVWIDRRQKAAAKFAVSEASGQSTMLTLKVNELENDVGAIAEDVKTIKSDFREMGQRVNLVERSLETVARQSDIASVNAELKHLSGGVTAELRVLSGMMHSFRESALRAAEKGKGS